MFSQFINIPTHFTVGGGIFSWRGGRSEVEQTRIVSSLFVLNAKKKNPPSSSASGAAWVSLLEEEPALPFAPASSCQASSAACLCRLPASPAASLWCIIHPSSPRAANHAGCACTPQRALVPGGVLHPDKNRLQFYIRNPHGCSSPPSHRQNKSLFNPPHTHTDASHNRD